MLSGHHEEENNSMNHADQLAFVRKKDYEKKLFVTVQITITKKTFLWSTSPNQSTITQPVQMPNKKNWRTLKSTMYSKWLTLGMQQISSLTQIGFSWRQRDKMAPRQSKQGYVWLGTYKNYFKRSARRHQQPITSL